MQFYPRKAVVPAGLKTPEFVLRPLRVTDNELDYDAVMSSRKMLRVWGQSDWPEDHFTLDDNLHDLKRHEREHIDRKVFTYTIMNPSESVCLGCVYIRPLRLVLEYFHVDDHEVSTFGDYAACVSFWVRKSHQDELEKRLLDALIEWFRQEWRFSRVVFKSNSLDRRQLHLFREAGLRRLYVTDIPDKEGQYLIYG
ncbi:MAG: GNAT family N-acetyltransferase [Candidatus Zixiibacteriota bacterium]|nr:MAG: GNAT family N-acetyltransferase [candidate division Zixibacteria bacterium]